MDIDEELYRLNCSLLKTIRTRLDKKAHFPKGERRPVIEMVYYFQKNKPAYYEYYVYTDDGAIESPETLFSERENAEIRRSLKSTFTRYKRILGEWIQRRLTPPSDMLEIDRQNLVLATLLDTRYAYRRDEEAADLKDEDYVLTTPDRIMQTYYKQRESDCQDVADARLHMMDIPASRFMEKSLDSMIDSITETVMGKISKYSPTEIYEYITLDTASNGKYSCSVHYKTADEDELISIDANSTTIKKCNGLIDYKFLSDRGFMTIRNVHEVESGIDFTELDFDGLKASVQDEDRWLRLQTNDNANPRSIWSDTLKATGRLWRQAKPASLDKNIDIVSVVLTPWCKVIPKAYASRRIEKSRLQRSLTNGKDNTSMIDYMPVFYQSGDAVMLPYGLNEYDEAAAKVSPLLKSYKTVFIDTYSYDVAEALRCVVLSKSRFSKHVYLSFDFTKQIDPEFFPKIRPACVYSNDGQPVEPFKWTYDEIIHTFDEVISQAIKNLAPTAGNGSTAGIDDVTVYMRMADFVDACKNESVDNVDDYVRIVARRGLGEKVDHVLIKDEDGIWSESDRPVDFTAGILDILRRLASLYVSPLEPPVAVKTSKSLTDGRWSISALPTGDSTFTEIVDADVKKTDRKNNSIRQSILESIEQRNDTYDYYCLANSIDGHDGDAAQFKMDYQQLERNLCLYNSAGLEPYSCDLGDNRLHPGLQKVRYTYPTADRSEDGVVFKHCLSGIRLKKTKQVIEKEQVAIYKFGRLPDYDGPSIERTPDNVGNVEANALILIEQLRSDLCDRLAKASNSAAKDIHRLEFMVPFTREAMRFRMHSSDARAIEWGCEIMEGGDALVKAFKNDFKGILAAHSVDMPLPAMVIVDWAPDIDGFNEYTIRYFYSEELHAPAFDAWQDLLRPVKLKNLPTQLQLF